MNKLTIRNPLNNAPVFYCDQVDSTMTVARELVRNGAPSGTVISTGYQTAGRGRISGRIWHADAGKNLLCTIILDKTAFGFSPGLLPLWVGEMLHILLSRYGLQGEIKWPNDLLIDGRKISGILCEADSSFFYIGIGINCVINRDGKDFRRPVTSLEEEWIERNIHNTADPEDLLKELLDIISRRLDSDPVDSISTHLYRKGMSVTVTVGDPGRNDLIEGVVKGVSQDGALIVTLPDGTDMPIVSGEVDYYRGPGDK